MNTIAFLSSIGPWEVAVIAVVGLLLFGRRLPEVGRSLGKGIVEFKKGLKGIEEEVDNAAEEDRKKIDADTGGPKVEASETKTKQTT